MKKRKLLHLLSMIIIVCLLVSSVSAAPSEANAAQPRYTRIMGFYSEIEINSAGRADCYGYVDVYDSTDTIQLTVDLQRSTTTATWTTIKSWTETGKIFLDIDEPWYVTSGSYYRVKVTAKIYTADGLLAENQYTTSRVLYYSP